MGSRHFLFLLVLSLTVSTGSTLNANQQFKYYMTSASGLQGDSVDLHVLFDNEKDFVQGWALGVCHDPSVLTIISVDNGVTTQAFNGGAGPDVAFYGIFGPPTPGWNSGVVISILGPEVLPPGEGFDLHIATYTLIGDPGTEGVNTLVCPCEQIGNPPAPLVAVVGGWSFPVDAECGEVHILASPFLRGDPNMDGVIDIGDAIFALNGLFVFGEPRAPCVDSLDTNDDGLFNIADPIYILSYLFGDGPPPFRPYPECGKDPTPDDLGCIEPHPGCS